MKGVCPTRRSAHAICTNNIAHCMIARGGCYKLLDPDIVNRMNILLVDDDANLRKSLRLALETMGHLVTEARDGSQAQEMVGRKVFEVALLDLRLAREQGLHLLPALVRLAPGMAVVVITAFATI